MGADLHIHVMTEDMTEEDFKYFFSHTLGSKWFTINRNYDTFGNDRGKLAMERVMNSPNVGIGEWSTLSALVYDDSKTFKPAPMQEVYDIIGESLPVIDDELIDRIKKAMQIENTTDYLVRSGEEIVKFLEEHKGKRVFTVSW